MIIRRILRSTWYILSILLITFLILSTLFKFTKFLIQNYYDDPFEKTDDPYIIENKTLILNTRLLENNCKTQSYIQNKTYFAIEHVNNSSCLLAQGHVIEESNKIIVIKSKNKIIVSRLFLFSKLYRKRLSLSVEDTTEESLPLCSEWIGIENN